MKRYLASLVLLFAAATGYKSEACTNIIVGKDASVDGSVICSYNCDGNAYYGSLWFYPGGVHKPGEMTTIHKHNHYEGTELDMTADVGAGPYGMPVRPLSRKFKGSDGETYFFERPIATQQTCYTMVCQMRNWLPDPVGGIMYYNCDDAASVAYVPIYCCCHVVPDAFDKKYADLTHFNPKGAYWLNNFVANMVYPRWSLVSPELKAAQKELEDYYEADQTEVLKAVEGMTISDMKEYLTQKSVAYTERMMERWGQLAERIIVRYNDLLQMKLDENGNINGNRKYTTPGYTDSFNEQIMKTTGDRYLSR